MAAFFMLILIIALMFGVRGAYRGARSFLGNQMSEWEASHPDAGGLHHRAAMLGHLLSLLRHGGPAIKAGFLTGFRNGWARGKTWAAKYKPSILDDPADPDSPDNAPEPTDPDAHDDERDTDAPPLRPDGRPDLRPVPSPVTQPADIPPTVSPPTPPNNPPGGNMTPEQIKAAAERMREQAAAELQDATAAKSRAQQAIRAIENLAASAAQVPYPPQDVAILKAAMEPAQMCVRAANTRIQAAEAMAARANQIAAVAAKHANMVGQAAGATYQGSGNRSS